MENREHHAPCFLSLSRALCSECRKPSSGSLRLEPVKLFHGSFTSVSETWRFTEGDKYGIIN